jgi:hypothetical protein
MGFSLKEPHFTKVTVLLAGNGCPASGVVPLMRFAFSSEGALPPSTMPPTFKPAPDSLAWAASSVRSATSGIVLAAGAKIEHFAKWLNSFKREDFRQLDANSLEKLKGIVTDITSMLEGLLSGQPTTPTTESGGANDYWFAHRFQPSLASAGGLNPLLDSAEGA